MIAIIRIKGKVKIKKRIEEALFRMRLRRKYSCVVVPKNKQNLGIIKKLENFVAYGEINKEVLKKLIEKRGKKIDKDKKIDLEKIENLQEISFENLKKANLKPFFRLHPPLRGIETKQRFPKGALGNHGKEINKLIEKML